MEDFIPYQIRTKRFNKTFSPPYQNLAKLLVGLLPDPPAPFLLLGPLMDGHLANSFYTVMILLLKPTWVTDIVLQGLIIMVNNNQEESNHLIIFLTVCSCGPLKNTQIHFLHSYVA